MKTVMNGVLIMLMISAMVTEGLGQGRGKYKNHAHKTQAERHYDSWSNERERVSYIPGDRYCYTPVHRHGPPSWAPAHGYRAKKRYVYYQDYDVYYDCHSRAFISYSGRNWVVSYEVPSCMRRCDFDRLTYVDVDYYADDLPRYIERRRPSVLVSVSARF